MMDLSVWTILAELRNVVVQAYSYIAHIWARRTTFSSSREYICHFSGKYRHPARIVPKYCYSMQTVTCCEMCVEH